jgi:hypothetical protein
MSDPVTLPRPSAAAHPAARAWGALRAGPAPRALEVLKETSKAGVYRLCGAGPDGGAVIAKRCRRPTALVERTVYEHGLPVVPAPTLRYYGFAEDEGGESAWLFVEDAAGEPYEPGRAEHRAAAARWLAALHTAPLPADLAGRLPDQGPACYRAHLDGARERLLAQPDNPALGEDGRAVLRRLFACFDALAAAWGELRRRCERLPRTLVHGDFVPKNLRVRHDGAGSAVLPFDWEVAGWGPPAADLAECPDLPAYREAVRRSWPELDAVALRRLTTCGRAFRALAAASWASGDLAYEGKRRKGLVNLRCYADELEGVLPALREGG